MQNHKTKAIQRLRTTALDENEAPLERLRAAHRLLIDHGATDRNVPIINRVVKQYVSDVDVNIAERAQKLKLKLAKAKSLKSEASQVEPIENEAPPTIVAHIFPKPAFSISLGEVVAAHQTVLGGFRWRQWGEGIELSEDEKTKLFEAILGSKPTVENVQDLYRALYRENSDGWTIAGSCPGVARIAKEFLKRNGISVEPPPESNEISRLLDRLNCREEYRNERSTI